MRCAIVHYWLLGMRGGEKVVEALCRLLPQADIFTLFYREEQISPIIRSHRVTVSGLNRFRRGYRSLLPLMPAALEQFDLRDYDLVISSESGPAKGIITSSNTRHVCYCHSPMRYLWDLYPAYLHEWTRPGIKRMLLSPLTHYLRLWDYASAARVDEFVANSKNVQGRIRKTYRRDSRVIYPPVDVGSFYHRPAKDYFLLVSEFVAYKRIDDAVQYFSRSGQALKLVGGGPEYKKLRAQAAGNVEFCGRVSDAELRDLYANCRAVLMPGEEDFGMVGVEAMASGKPLIALGRGGALESTPPNYPPGSYFYEEAGVKGLESAIHAFEKNESLIVPAILQAHSSRFGEARFFAEMANLLGIRLPEQMSSGLADAGAA